MDHKERIRRLLKILPNANEENLSNLADGESLADSGIIDSLGFVHLLSAIEADFGLTLEADDLTTENFRSIESINLLLDHKLRKESPKSCS